jgi:plasmid maintenance system antidote protein VapI
MRSFSASVGLAPTQLCGWADFLETPARFWLNLQVSYHLELEAERLGTKLTRDVEILPRSA